MYIDPEGLRTILMTVPARATRSVRGARGAYQRTLVRQQARQQAAAIAARRAKEAGQRMTREKEQALVEEIYKTLIEIIKRAEAQGKNPNICLEKSCPPSAPQCKVGEYPEEPALSAPAKHGEIPPIFDKKGCHCVRWLRNSIF